MMGDSGYREGCSLYPGGDQNTTEAEILIRQRLCDNALFVPVASG
jgi:hypothetical protein